MEGLRPTMLLAPLDVEEVAKVKPDIAIMVLSLDRILPPLAM